MLTGVTEVTVLPPGCECAEVAGAIVLTSVGKPKECRDGLRSAEVGEGRNNDWRRLAVNGTLYHDW